MERDEAWVLDMLLAARKVRQFTADANWEAFSANEILQNAVMHQIQVIGEAATKISPSFLDAHPEIPWPQIIGMRHRLVHGYFRIQAERVWEVVESVFGRAGHCTQSR